MTKYAWIADGEVVETVVLDEGIGPHDVYHPDIASEFVPATQLAEQGWLYSGWRHRVGRFLEDESTLALDDLAGSPSDLYARKRRLLLSRVRVPVGQSA